MSDTFKFCCQKTVFVKKSAATPVMMAEAFLFHIKTTLHKILVYLMQGGFISFYLEAINL